MGELIPLDRGAGLSNRLRMSLGTLRQLAGMNPAEFAEALSEEAGEPVPTFVYLAYEGDETPPRTIQAAARRVVDQQRHTTAIDPSDTVFGTIDRHHLDALFRHSWPVDAELLEQFEHAHDRLNARSEVEPPRAVKPDLRSWLDILQDLLLRSHPDLVMSRLRSMAARTANHLGYLSFRDLHRSDALSYYGLSETLAREAGDDTELAILLLRRQRLIAATEGTTAAVNLVEAVGELLTAGSPSGLTAWRWGERARQESLLRHELAAWRYLDLAMSAAERDPGRLNLFAADKDSRWLQRRPAYVALHLGHAEQAIEMLERNRAGSDPTFVRETVWNSIELAEAWAVNSDLEIACEYIDDALARAVATEDVRAVSFIRKVRSRRMARWAHDTRLKALDARLGSANL